MIKKEVKNCAILEAAGDLFLLKGMQGTTMEEIAKNSGVSKATLYKYYPTKASILEELFDRLIQNIKEQIPLQYNPDQSLETLLINIIHHKFNLLNDPQFIKLIKIISIEQVKKPGYDPVVAQKIIAEEQNFIPWIKQCQQDHKITFNYTPEMISEWFHGLFYGLMLWPLIFGIRERFKADEIPHYTKMICKSFIDMFQFTPLIDTPL